MVRTTAIVLASCAVLVPTTLACAGFTHMSVEEVIDTGLPPCGGGSIHTFRVYANFDDTADQLLAVTGDVDAPLTFITDCPGGLYNDGGPYSGLIAEDWPTAPFGSEFDSYVTIGGSVFGTDVAFTPGFLGGDGVHSVIRGSAFVEDSTLGGSWYDDDPTTPVTGGHILIAQVTLCIAGECAFEVCGNLAFKDGTTGELTLVPFCAAPDEPADPDLDGDGTVGFNDLVIMLASWGVCGDPCPADLDGDGNVGFGDVLALLAAWS